MLALKNCPSFSKLGKKSKYFFFSFFFCFYLRVDIWNCQIRLRFPCSNIHCRDFWGLRYHHHVWNKKTNSLFLKHKKSSKRKKSFAIHIKHFGINFIFVTGKFDIFEEKKIHCHKKIIVNKLCTTFFFFHFWLKNMN